MDGSGVLPGVEELTQALIATATAATQAVQAASTTAAGVESSTGEPICVVKKNLARLTDEEVDYEKPVDEEEKRIREDKGVSFKREDPALAEVMPISTPTPLIDVENNRAGPSSLTMPSTLRPARRKNVQVESSPQPEAKKMKPMVEKQTHSLEVTNPDRKRVRKEGGDHVEKRISATQVGSAKPCSSNHVATHSSHALAPLEVLS